MSESEFAPRSKGVCETGAEAVVETLLASGVNCCFANPGTSELGFVAALDRYPEMRSVLVLQENVATGAADGYARMTGGPAATLLHLGPGLANGLSCLHNARRARSPVVNLVGDHATYHLEHDAPLTTDLAGVAAPFSDWVGKATNATVAGAQTSEAVAQARAGCIATLLLPADACWSGPAVPSAPVEAGPDWSPDPDAVVAAATALRRAKRPILMLGHGALRPEALATAAAIAKDCGAEILAGTHNPRISRGAGRESIERLPYPIDQALARLAGCDALVLCGARRPVAFFAYPGKPSDLAPADCFLHDLCRDAPFPLDAPNAALGALASELGVSTSQGSAGAPRLEIGCPTGTLTPGTIGRSLARHAPEGTVVADDAVTSGRSMFSDTIGAAPHEWLQTTGGAIGHGMPMATGAAVAAPDRTVICLQADGAGMYAPQALWTQAREGLKVITIVLSNRRYAILRGEFANLGLGQPGPAAEHLTRLDQPEIDWTSLSRGMGVPGTAVEDAEAFDAALKTALASDGPYLIEARI
ncbi:MAG: acetolactate synthase large subunit [Sediminimonas qiaohouensis]|uniref:Acetolactate synthase large subunit n=1 Tax=Sediminimonas qiaohouensis TaxID=552061 RepID=A0A7C9HB10_9RHOB|nr:acetolactate synthase large subunit [Sediminimonas qiaohouensis]MTJ04786.1 acetolactate synthase large subunit [Sediminimonas qiaohouensis]